MLRAATDMPGFSTFSIPKGAAPGIGVACLASFAFHTSHWEEKAEGEEEKGEKRRKGERWGGEKRGEGAEAGEDRRERERKRSLTLPSRSAVLFKDLFICI